MDVGVEVITRIADAVESLLLEDRGELLVDRRDRLDPLGLGVLAIGFVVSFVTAIIAVKSFLAFVKKRDFTLFGWYRIVLAIVFYFAK